MNRKLVLAVLTAAAVSLLLGVARASAWHKDPDSMVDPVKVVAWLANTLGSMGAKLEAGHLVMTGALHAAVPMRAGDVPATFANAERLRTATGFAPATPLKDGIRRFVDWYLEFYGRGEAAAEPALAAGA